MTADEAQGPVTEEGGFEPSEGSGGSPTRKGKVRVAVVGTGSWAQRAHIPGWQRDPRSRTWTRRRLPRRPANSACRG
jgi:hypothetical protein